MSHHRDDFIHLAHRNYLHTETHSFFKQLGNTSLDIAQYLACSFFIPEIIVQTFQVILQLAISVFIDMIYRIIQIYR